MVDGGWHGDMAVGVWVVRRKGMGEQRRQKDWSARIREGAVG